MKKPSKLPDIERLKELFEYDSKTGRLRRLRQCQRDIPKKGKYLPDVKPMGSGYIRIAIDGKQYLAHRVCWALYYSKDPYPLEIDHRDENKTNNRINNLRIATKGQQNAAKTGKMGYHWKEDNNAFEVTTRENGVITYIGLTPCPLIARVMYIEKVKDLWGEFCPPFVPTKTPIGRPFPL